MLVICATILIPKERTAAFMNAMNAATDFLLENSLLCNEFRMMGIDFETILIDEKQLAIKRWMSNMSS